MAATQEIENQINFMGYGDPYHLSSGDHSTLQLGSTLFNGQNYLNWTRSVRMALAAKNKIGFIDGSLKKPAITHKDYSKWVRNDSMVRCWIHASIDSSIGDSLIYLDSAKLVWDELKERYGQTNAPLLYQLKRAIHDLRQENKNVTEYYCKLKSLWDEISSIEGVPECTCGAMSKCTCNVLKKLMDAENLNKLIQFLMALNESYENIKGNILSMEPLPAVNRAFHLVQQLEKQKEVSGELHTGFESSAMAVSKSMTGNWQKRETKEEKMKKKCDHCFLRGHTKEECFKLVGYPEWFDKPRGKNKEMKNNNGKVPANRSAMSVGKQSEVHQETPLEKKNEQNESSNKVDVTMLSTVIQQVMKAMEEKASSSSNFAGPYL